MERPLLEQENVRLRGLLQRAEETAGDAWAWWPGARGIETGSGADFDRALWGGRASPSRVHELPRSPRSGSPAAAHALTATALYAAAGLAAPGAAPADAGSSRLRNVDSSTAYGTARMLQARDSLLASKAVSVFNAYRHSDA
jgi:hypothetical protein